MVTTDPEPAPTGFYWTRAVHSRAGPFPRPRPVPDPDGDAVALALIQALRILRYGTVRVPPDRPETDRE